MRHRLDSKGQRKGKVIDYRYNFDNLLSTENFEVEKKWPQCVNETYSIKVFTIILLFVIYYILFFYPVDAEPIKKRLL